jgi:ssDNA-binding Zn-finger/Zn-ribbon topoisomerase 1
MKANQRIKISELRKQGYGYKKIAKALSLTVSIVRYACNTTRNEDLLSGICEHCGLRMMSMKGKKKKRFCCDKCRWRWWNAHQNEVNRKVYFTYTCKYCHQEFNAYGQKKRIYCSHDCYIKFRLNQGVTSHETR